jgi:hypothetical protein
MARIGVTIDGLTSVAWDKVMFPRFQDLHIEIAERALKDAVTKGFDTSPTVVTDGVVNRDYHQVKPFGRIEWDRKSTSADAGRWIMQELERRSPVLTGRYQKSHVFLINGQIADYDVLSVLGPRGVLQIANTQPYANKIEGRDAYTRWETRYSKRPRKGQLTHRGKRKKQGWSRSDMAGESPQAPNGVYRVVLGEAVARFGKSIQITFAPLQLNLGVQVWSKQGGMYQRKKYRLNSGMARQRVLKPQIYPCFTIQSKSLFM